MIPPQEVLALTGSLDLKSFQHYGKTFFKYFLDLCDLEPSDRILDVGCSSGRMAIPLAEYLNEQGSYEGFDITPSAIQWCQENITPQYPNFRFQTADVYNGQYNPAGKFQAAEFRFPYESSSFDFIFLASVFTHMLPPDMENYLAEIARVLKPGGRCFISFFLLNDVSMAWVKKGIAKQLRFDRDCGFYRLANPDTPEAAIAFDEDYIRKLYDRNGLQIREFFYGKWSRRETYLSDQDIILAVKESVDKSIRSTQPT